MKNIWLSSTHLLQLINDILDISKIDAGKTNLANVCQELFLEVAQKKGVLNEPTRLRALKQ